MAANNDALASKIAKWKTLVDQHPDHELARYSLGSAYFEAGRFAEAEPHFARALELKGDWVMAYLFRAKCLMRIGRAAEARPLLLLGRTHSQAQGHDAPIEEIDALLEMLP